MVCTGLVGDTLMCLPAIAAAKGLFPSAERVGLVTPKTQSLLGMAACLDRVIVCEASPLTLRPAARRALAVAVSLVRASRFDLAVIFLGDDFAPILTRARIPHRVFVSDGINGRLATASYEIGHPRTWGPEERRNAWRVLGLEPSLEPASLTPPPDAVAALEARIGPAKGRRRIAVHPFGRTTDQHWPLAAVREFIRLAETRLGVECLVIGESPTGATLAATDPPFRLVGKLSLEELAALMARSSCVVSTDSGPFHMAGVLERPGVGLFRASRPEHAGRYPSIAPVVAPDLEACRGRCTWDRCRRSPCEQMSAILPETVLQAARTRLSREPVA